MLSPKVNKELSLLGILRRNVLKRLIFALLMIFVMAVSALGAEANVNIQVYGEDIEAKGYIVEGRTLIPLRGIFEKLGYGVEYDTETKTAVISSDITTMEFTDGKDFFLFNGLSQTLEVPQRIIDGHFVIPLNGVLNLIAKKAEWNGETKTVNILDLDYGIKVYIGISDE